MRTKYLSIIISLLLTMGFSGCSNDEIDPNDYATSWLTGDYEKDGLLKLYVTEDGEPLSDYGSVRFDCKYDGTEAKIRFVNVIPGVASKQFKNVPLVGTEEGLTFTIEYDNKGKSVVIKGIVELWKMTVDIKN